jgi:DNA-binding PadR family transcriptional regulator
MTSTTTKEILNALSDANAYRIFQRQRGFSSYRANSTEMSPKTYYTAMNKLKKANLIAKHAKQYNLTNLGKIVWNSLQIIDKSVQLQWALNALDAIQMTNGETDSRDKVVQVLIPDEQIRNIVMEVK